MTSSTEANDWARRLESLGEAVRKQLIAARNSSADMASAVAHEGGDTIFAIDRHVEPVIEQTIAAWPASCFPLLLIAEGMGEDGRRSFPAKSGIAGATKRWRLIVDPIDGTRNIMYDKRAAWFIAAVAPDRGESTSVADAVASVMVELPPSKAGFADSFSATREAPARAKRVDLRTGAAADLAVRPSEAPTLRNGFGQVSNFFPGTKVLASELMERIVHATLGEVEPGSASVFDDQYITTAGQMIELMVGHDRFCCDLRPLFYRIVSRTSGKEIRGLECHPYDVAGLLVAQRSGVIITDGLGRPLSVPMDVETGVHWCGYANAKLRDAIEPVIGEWMRERGISH
ncbi:MAG: inositol monophosphatase [Planctomycetota bacterium]|nr:inositol monophosphatase [Planctomycetota bacterium]